MHAGALSVDGPGGVGVVGIQESEVDFGGWSRKIIGIIAILHNPGPLLGVGFTYFLFSPLLGEGSYFD